MAACDYRLCDLCSRKVYYDASVDYGAYGERLGDWAVICSDCARDHRVVIVKTGEQEKQAAEIAALREAVRAADEMFVYEASGGKLPVGAAEWYGRPAVRRALEGRGDE